MNGFNERIIKSSDQLKAEGVKVGCVFKENGGVFDGKLNTNCHAKYEIGVKEKMNGVSLFKLSELKNVNCGPPSNLRGYDCVKELWGYPSSRDFRIDVSTPLGASTTIQATFPQSLPLPQGINVFARQFNSFVLTDEGERIPVQVSIKIW